VRIALDTNVLAYAEGVGDELRCSAAMQWVERLSSHEVVLPAQTLGELSRVLTFQNGFTWRGVTVANPFVEPHAPLLAGLLRGTR